MPIMRDGRDMSQDESLLEFPCPFPIKMMGRESSTFKSIAIEIVERHAGPLDAASVKTAPSSNGNFTSVTVTINAQSQQQLDDIYRDLTSHDAILVAL